ncbi:MAG: glycosyl transferase family protein [Methylomicrobium sp.]
MQTQEHPFAEYVRILGKGKKGSRSLTREEAYRAMRMILTDQVLPVQLGAFLMLMRVKEESREELAGFVDAARETFIQSNRSDIADLDWSSYAGKRRHLPWFLLSALLLSENGIKVFMHGAGGHTAGRLYTHDALTHLGLEVATSLEEASQQLERRHFSYLPLQYFCPKLHEIIELRPLMGLRSPVHTLVRLLNPLNAKYSIQGIFHPGYRPVHQEAALLLNQPHAAVLKGEGGEVERNPDADCLVQCVCEGQLFDETWPRMFERRHIKSESLDPSRLAAVWRGETDDEYGIAAVIGTAAIALKLLGKADSQEQAIQIAESFWEHRSKNV